MKYHKGQKVQDKRDNIRGRVVDYFEQEDTKYWIEVKDWWPWSKIERTYIFFEPELEPVLEVRLFAFIIRAWEFIKSDWIVSAIVFVLGVVIGMIL